MTGYFDALLRSGGLLGEQRSVASKLARAEADPRVLEAEQFDRTPPAADVPPSPTPLPERRVIASEPAPGADEALAARIDAPPPADPSEQPGDARQMPSARVQDRLSEAGDEDIGRTRVQAALRWVAAAPTQTRAEGPPSEEHAYATVPDQPGGEGDVLATAARSTEAPAVMQGDVEKLFQQHRLDPSLPSVQMLPSEPAQPARAERAVGLIAEMAAPADRPLAAKAREETVEVSIGAIHIRVDAAPIPAGARIVRSRPTTSVPGADRTGTQSASHNSRLARRGLRRV
jgi:hypothetical protein